MLTITCQCPLGISRKHLNVTSIKWGHNCFHTYHLFLCFHIFNQPFRHDTTFIDYWLCTRMYLMLWGPSASPPTLWLEQELYVFPPFPHPSPPYLSHQQVLFILSPINTEYTNFSISLGLILWSKLSSASSSWLVSSFKV